MTIGENREALFALARAMIPHVNIGVNTMVNTIGSTMTSRLRDLVRMNPSIFHGWKLEEDPYEFHYGVYKVFSFMGGDF